MFRRGGIFSGFGALDFSSLPIVLDPKAGKGVPFTSLLQTVMNQQGATKLPVDGQWGQCSHSAFKNTFGVAPSYDSLNTLFSLDKFGVPASNVSVWKPGLTDVCWSGNDKYTTPSAEQQAINPHPAILLAQTFGLPVPAGVCPGGGVADPVTQQCGCPPNTYKNVNTGNCDAMESPAKLDPGTTATTTTTPGTTRTYHALPKISIVQPTAVPGAPASSAPAPVVIGPIKHSGTAVKSYPCPADHPFYPKQSLLCDPNSQYAYPVMVGGVKSKTVFKCLNGATPVDGKNPITGEAAKLCPGASGGTSTGVAASTGMSTGVKLGIALVAVVALGGGAWFMLRSKPAQTAAANRRRRRRAARRRYRCNCGFSANCGE